MNISQVQTFLACLSEASETHELTHQRPQSKHENSHESDEHEDTITKDILIAKATAMTVLFCASAICGSVPFILNRYFKWTERQNNARSALAVQLMLYFGGGVLLSTTFLHLLPEVQEAVEKMENCDIIPSLGFPLAEMLMCVGFFFMYLIEETIHAFIAHHRKRLDSDEARATAAFQRGHSVRNSYLANENKKNASAELNGKSPNDNLKEVSTDEINSSGKNDRSLIGDSAAKSEIHKNNFMNKNHGHSHMAFNEPDSIVTSSIRGLFIVLALSLHELFEGMAIGLENESAAAVWFMFGAVSAHKLVLAFCVGVELILAQTRMTLAIIYVITFAIVSPIGIGIGILLSSSTANDSAAPTIPAAILQGLACGTLLYVVFFEILSNDHKGLRAYFALVVGFLVMFGLQQIGSDEHHEHSGCGHTHDHDAQSEKGSFHLEHLQGVNRSDQVQILRSLLGKIIENV